MVSQNSLFYSRTFPNCKLHSSQATTLASSYLRRSAKITPTDSLVSKPKMSMEEMTINSRNVRTEFLRQ